MHYLLRAKQTDKDGYTITFVSDQHLAQSELAVVSFDYLIKLFITDSLTPSNELDNDFISQVYAYSQTARKTYKLDKQKNLYNINEDIRELREKNSNETLEKAISLTKKLLVGIQ